MKLQESWKKRLKKWQGQNKKSFAEWWDKKSNSAKVLCAAILSAIIFLLIYFAVIKNSSENSVGSWNFIILIVSSPVAFVIWHFRDENSRQQIENQRKDINLKEFQKLSEWVSGAHLPEINIEKSITKSSSTTDNESAASPKKQITEQTAERSKEYGQKPDNAHWGTFSKRDGAVALQISAIYNLLPFFRGDYGESFRQPAFNLLKSAWQSMQQESLNELNELDVEIVSLERQREKLELQREKLELQRERLERQRERLERQRERLELQERQIEIHQQQGKIYQQQGEIRKQQREKIYQQQSEIRKQQSEIRKQQREIYQQQSEIRKQQREIIGKLKQNAQSPMGVALTHVLLSLNRESTRLNLQDFTEMLPNICLAGISFNFSEIKEKARDLSKLNLNGADLRAADLFFVNLHGTNLSNAKLSNAKLSNADLSNADLSKADLSNADLSKADLLDANLLSTDLRRSVFTWMKLQESRSLFNAKISINNFRRDIYPYWKQTDSQRWGNLTEPERKEAMQTFCNETYMIIFDDDGNVVAKR